LVVGGEVVLSMLSTRQCPGNHLELFTILPSTSHKALHGVGVRNAALVSEDGIAVVGEPQRARRCPGRVRFNEEAGGGGIGRWVAKVKVIGVVSPRRRLSTRRRQSRAE